MQKYYKLSRKERKLTQPPELKFIKLTSLALTTFLITFLSISILTPQQNSSASSDLLVSYQADAGTVSLRTSAAPVSLSLTSGSAGAMRTVSDDVYVTASAAGYQLYLSTAGSTNALIRDGATPTSANPTTYASSDLILAGGGDNVSSPATLGNGTWGFALASPNSTSGSGSEDVVASGFDSSYPTGDDSDPQNKFAKVPAKGSDLLIAKNAGVTTDALTRIYYGTKITSSNTSGLYKGTVTYTVIGNSSASGLASVTPSRTAQLAGGEVITIATPSTAALSSLDTITATVGGQTCSNPNAYKSSDGVSVNVTCTTPALATGFHDVAVSFAGTSQSYIVAGGLEYYQDATSVANTFQDFTVSDCIKLYANQTITLKDARDDQTYTVTKLPDGNCWQTQNLRLGSTIMNSGSIEINSENSDYTGTAFSITSDNIMAAGKTNNWTENDYDTLHIYARDVTELDVNSGNIMGNVYNWYTATARSGTQSMGSSNATSSICPKNWTLPSATGNGSYENLFMTPKQNGGLGITTTNGTSVEFRDALFAAPYYFSITRGWDNGALENDPQYGVYWSNTSDSGNGAFSFYVKLSGSYNFRNTNRKNQAIAMRCVLKVSSMQDFTAAMCDNLATAKTISLYDNRDNKTYAVAKLADGNCWQTQNLRLGDTDQNITLTSHDSDVVDDFTIPASAVETTPTSSWNNADAVHVYTYLDNPDISAENKILYGNLYNYYTATAGTGTTNTAANEDASNSICPKGWRLPSETQYRTLKDAAVGQIFADAPYNFLLAGGIGVDESTGEFTVNNYGLYGYYITRTTDYVNTHVWSLATWNTNQGMNVYNKFDGRSVRCIFSS